MGPAYLLLQARKLRLRAKLPRGMGAGGWGVARGSLPVKGDGEWGWEDLRRENIKEEREKWRETERDRQRD